MADDVDEAPQHPMQIGHVADRIGLSLRTIRYYEEVGLVSPSDRSQGGFRLYTERDVSRLQLVKDMKPLGFSIDEMRDLLGILDELDRLDRRATGRGNDAGDGDPRGAAAERDALLERLTMFRITADARCEALRAELRIATSFAHQLRHRTQASPPAPPSS